MWSVVVIVMEEVNERSKIIGCLVALRMSVARVNCEPELSRSRSDKMENRQLKAS